MSFGFAAWLLLLLDTGRAVGLPGAGWVAVFGMILPSPVAPAVGAGAGVGVGVGPEAGAGTGPPVENVGVPAGGTASGAL